VKESSRYRRKRSGLIFFSLLTDRMMIGFAVIIIAAACSALLWPMLIYSLYLLPVWIIGSAIYLYSKKQAWTVPDWKVSALTDIKSKSMGAFMTVKETSDSSWAQDFSSPNISLNTPFPLKDSFKWLIAVLAIVAVLLLPDLRSKTGDRPAFAPLERMENMVSKLRDENLAEEEYLERAEQMLKELKDETNKNLESDDWQALDYLKKDLSRQTLESLSNLKKEHNEYSTLKEALNSREDMMEKINQALDSNNIAELAKMSGLSEDKVKELMNQSEINKSALEKLASLASQNLSGVEMQKLAAAMNSMKNIDPSKLCKLCNLSEEMMKKLMDRCKSGKGKFSSEEIGALIEYLSAAEAELERKGLACLRLAQSLNPG